MTNILATQLSIVTKCIFLSQAGA